MTSAGILKAAAEIVRSGWTQKACARNAHGEPLVSTAHRPAHVTVAERPLYPVQFDVGGAIFRAASAPKTTLRKEDAKLLYLSVINGAAYRDALRLFCAAAGTMHASIWNDTICKSAEEAAVMLERAAQNDIASSGLATDDGNTANLSRLSPPALKDAI